MQANYKAQLSIQLYMYFCMHMHMYMYVLTNMATRGCLHEGCVAILILVFHVRSSVQEYLDDIFITSAASVGERRVPYAGLGIDVSSVVYE